MHKRVEELKEVMHTFVDQADEVLLILDARDLDMPLVHKIIESVDLEHPADIVLRFAEPATDPLGYVDAILANLETQMTAVDEARALEGNERWPPLPASCRDPARPPVDRIKTAMKHVRGLFPMDEDHRIVWCFLPVKIPNPAAYSALIGGLLPRRGPEPWMASTRVVARDRNEDRFLIPHVEAMKLDLTLVYRVNFSTEAMIDSLVEETRDPQTPEPRRMQNLLMLAGIDYAHKRYADAIDKYRVVYNYHEKHGRPVLQALALGGVGDALMASGDVDGAKVRYQQGLALSAPRDVEGLPVTMQLCARAGDACMHRKEYEEAEGYYDLASQIAGKLMNLEFKCDMMEKVGIARQARKNIGGAVQIWTLGVERCKDGNYYHRWKSILDRLVLVYDQAGMRKEKREAERERAGLEVLMKEQTT